MAQKLERALPPVAITVATLAAALYTVAVMLAGGSLPGALLYPLVFGLYVFLPGLALCNLLLPAVKGAARLAVSVPLGACLLMLCYVLLGWFAAPVLCGLPCVLFGLVWVLYNRGRVRMPQFAMVPTVGWWLLLVFALALLLYLFTGIFPYAHASAAGNMTYNQDMLWSVGNAAAAQYGLPLADLRAAGGVLNYHFFADALVGLLAVFSGQSAYDAMCYFSWPLWCAALVLGAYAAARGLGGSRRAAAAVPAGLLFGCFLWQEGFVHLFINMNGVLPALLFFLCAVLVVQAGTAGGGWHALLAFAMVFAALVWSKSTVGALFLCALAAAALVGSITGRRVQWWPLAALGAGAAVFGALYLAVYRFATNNLVFQPRAWGPESVGWALLSFLPCALLYLGSLFFSIKGFTRLRLPALLVNAMVPGGMLAFVLFTHYSASQNYFLIFALFAAWLCAVPAIDALLAARPGQLALGAAGAAALVGTLFTAAPTARTGVQAALRCVGMRPAFELSQQSITPDDEAAARWLRENMALGQVFATNRNAKDPQVGEGVFHYYTAASEQQAFVEGWRYAMDYSIDYFLLRHNLEEVSDGLYRCETFAQAQALAAENGIDYILVYLPFQGQPWADGKPVFANPTVWVYGV